ncbi:MAG: hypothetical protein KAS32_01560 [Candidatus Peribacteraceae bacterium]|nr:hypothetical protein [Candidatus Peribacteraceae bacterium]
MAKKTFTSSNVQKKSIKPKEIQPMKVVLIEKTDKKYKIVILAGAILFWISIILIIYNLNEYVELEQAYGKELFEIGATLTYEALIKEQPAIQVAIWGAVIGFIIKRFGKFIAWWNHG